MFSWFKKKKPIEITRPGKSSFKRAFVCRDCQECLTNLYEYNEENEITLCNKCGSELIEYVVGHYEWADFIYSEGSSPYVGLRFVKKERKRA